MQKDNRLAAAPNDLPAKLDQEDLAQEAARALTGWKMVAGRAVFDPAEFDDSEKTVFGKTGKWTSGDVVRLWPWAPPAARHGRACRAPTGRGCERLDRR